MKIFRRRKQNQAITLLEILIVVGVIAILMLIIIPGFSRARARSIRIACVNNLKQTALSFLVWSGDNRENYPMAVPGTNGGTMEFITGTNAFRHFQVMSNELSTPYVLACPSEPLEFRHATNFTDMNNSNISFFVGIDANKANRQMILAGDRNLTNDMAPKNGLIELTTNRLTLWTSEMHKRVGNVALADFSVRMVDIPGARELVAKTGFPTNRLQMPIFVP
jgi:type II secretory pathway pseudopilin PulG